MWPVIAICLGASAGALARWGLGLWLSTPASVIPWGTLAANLIGGYLIGLALAFFATNTSVAPEWRLFAITGFLGALTTFSTFSAESVMLLQQARYGAAFAHASLHLFGSVLATIAGFASWRLLHA